MCFMLNIYLCLRNYFNVQIKTYQIEEVRPLFHCSSKFTSAARVIQLKEKFIVLINIYNPNDK